MLRPMCPGRSTQAAACAVAPWSTPRAGGIGPRVHATAPTWFTALPNTISRRKPPPTPASTTSAREKKNFTAGTCPFTTAQATPPASASVTTTKSKAAGIGNARRNSLPDWNTALKTTGKPSWNTATTVRKPSIPVWVTPHTAISGTTTARPEPIFIKWPTISSAMPSASSSTGNTIYGGANTKPYSASEATARGTNAPGQTLKATIP